MTPTTHTNRTAQPSTPAWVRVDVPAENAHTAHGHTIPGRPACSYLYADLGELPGEPGHALACYAPAPDQPSADGGLIARVTYLGDPSNPPFTKVHLAEVGELDPDRARAQALADVEAIRSGGILVPGGRLRITFADGFQA